VSTGGWQIPELGPRTLGAIFALALVARLAAVGLAGFSTVRFGDARAYLYAAVELVNEGQYPLSTEPFYFRAPGYPFFLAAATLGRPDSVPRAKVATALVGSFTAPLLALLSARIFRKRGVALATGVAAALHPAFLWNSADVQSESLFTALLLAAGFLLLVATDRPSSTLALAAGATLALAALTRASALALVPFLAAPLFDRRYPLRARAHLAGAAVLGFALAIAPWTARNALVFGEFVPVNDAAGNAFYQGNSDWQLRFFEVRSRDQYLRWVEAMHRDMTRQTEELRAGGRTSPSERSRYFVSRAIAERSADPAGWFRLLFRKSWEWVRPYPTPWFWPRTIVVAVGVLYVLLFAFAALGFLTAPRPGVRAFALGVMAVSLVVHVLVLVVWRYRVPYWDPVLLLYGTFAAGGTLLERWKR
jgi:4-amino-4-deoxy-L-arabinose transferase-like glycosyltransferase